MGNRSILTGALALGLLMAAVPEGHADQTVPEGYVRVAMAHGVPPGSALLSLTERVFAQTSPWRAAMALDHQCGRQRVSL
jgi:hypothetical protein